IQNIEIEQSLLPRMLGTAKVKIETAGSQSTEGVLEYVALEEARRIRSVIRSLQRKQKAPSTAAAAPSEQAPDATAPEAEVTDEEPARTLLFGMPLQRVLLAGTFRFSLLYLAVIFSILQQFDLNRVAETVATWFARGRFEPYAEMAQSSPWLVGTVVAVITLFLGWVTGVSLTLNKYYRFRLWREGDKLHKKSGLLTVSEGTIPLRRIQTLILRSNPIMRAFGWYRLELQTMGYDVEERGHQDVIPFAKLDTIHTLAPHIRPFTMPDRLMPVSKLHIRRTMVRYTVGLLAVVGAVAYFWSTALWGLLLLPALLVLAVLQYRNHGYALHEDMLFIRRGVFSQHLWIVPLDKLQVFYAQGSLFQRRLGLRSLILDTAGAGGLRYPRILDIPKEQADIFLEKLYARFQAHFTRPSVRNSTASATPIPAPARPTDG
ncbi:MAG: PH domain-containing protein, partial [Bacteroidetes bacterium]|nr:PH domain-containing protein [Bacteroidota bacterium]